MPVSSKLWRIAPSNRPMVGKVLHAGKAHVLQLGEEARHQDEGSVPLTPASTGVFFTTGSTSSAISLTISLALP